MTLPRIIMFLVLSLALAACANRKDEVTLTRIKNKSPGPDEFTILPGKPLQAPESFSMLPTPNPGGPNLTDQNPNADGIAALGGNPAALAPTGVPASDAGLVQYSSRYGTASNVRQVLRAEDREVRRRYGRVNILRIGPTDDYTDAYRRQWLDSHAEEERLRRRGVLTPSNPPKQR